MLGEKVLLFDLGGVLVDVAPVDHMLSSLGLPTEQELLARMVAIPPWIQLEVGEIDGPAFGQAFVDAFGLDLHPARVLEEFEAWNLGFFEGAVEILTALRQRHRTAVLSNTNEVHWKRLSGEMAIATHVEVAFASHLIRLRKPDTASYLHVARELRVEPQDLVFFDDNAANIEGALSLGIDTHHVFGIEALRDRLTTLGYL
jgi:putative hydrolase of the HAD superfamily